MSISHKIGCKCGQLRGLLRTTSPSNRCVCYCKDCQAFVRHLGAGDALDEYGGTEIIQVPAPNLTFTQGAENLACLRLTEAGMLRWYSACCRTPIGNTLLNWRICFIGLIHPFLNVDGQSMDAAFGPVTMRVNVQGAIGHGAPAACGLLGGMAKVLAMSAKVGFSGQYRSSPLFDPATGSPVAKPIVLTPDELRAAKQERPTA